MTSDTPAYSIRVFEPRPEFDAIQVAMQEGRTGTQNYVAPHYDAKGNPHSGGVVVNFRNTFYSYQPVSSIHCTWSQS